MPGNIGSPCTIRSGAAHSAALQLSGLATQWLGLCDFAGVLATPFAGGRIGRRAGIRFETDDRPVRTESRRSAENNERAVDALTGR